MRWVPVALAAVLLVVLPPAAAHGGGHAEHLTVRVDDLEPRQNRTLNLTFEGGPFAAGWVFFVYGSVQADNATVLVDLATPDGGPVASWAWAPGDYHLNATVLPDASEYRLTFSNPSDEAARYAFYFDQSCDCTDKTIGLTGGPGLFNWNIQADRDVSVEFTVARFDADGLPTHAGPDVTVRASAALRTGEGASWPDDYEVLAANEAAGSKLYLNWTASEEARHYVWVEVVSGASPQNPVILLPRLSADASGGASPAPSAALAVGAAVLAVATLAYRRRGPHA